MAKGKAALEMQVREDFGGLSMQRYLMTLDDKLKRRAIRSMVGKAGTTLAKEVRKQIKRRDMPYSRGRNAEERRKARTANIKPLLRTISTRTWNKASKGIFGSVVGPSHQHFRHAHLVEFGHVITGRVRVKFTGLSIKSLLRGKLKTKKYRLGRKRIANSGTRTVAHMFQTEAMEQSDKEIYNQMRSALTKFMEKQGRKVKV